MMQSDPEEEDDEHPCKQNKLRPQLSGLSSMVLRAHATINNNKTKNFHTKLVTTRPTRQQMTTKDTDETENDQNKINTKPEPVEMVQSDDTEKENVETDSKEKIIGTFVTKTVGIRKHKKARRAKCRICEKSCANVKELNQHHRSDHDNKFCPKCRKGFNTQTSLDKHKYLHKDLSCHPTLYAKGLWEDIQKPRCPQ